MTTVGTTQARSHPLALVGLAAVSAATTLIALCTWQVFTDSFGSTLGPLLVIATVIAGIGALARWWRAPRSLTVLAQLVLAGMVTSTFLCGSPIPVGDALDRFVLAFTDAVDTANRFAPPVPAGAPPVHPLLIAGGAGCLLLVDLFACTVRRVPLAGLPLLTIFSVPVSMTGDGPHWVIFTITAIGFLSMIFLSETEQVARWGPILIEDRGASEPKPLAIPAWPRTGARAIGGLATALAIVVPLAIPTLSVHLFDFGPGSGGDDDINIENPMIDLRRDLRRGDDIAMLRITTDDPDPSYLRIAVLNRLRGNEWSSGNREVPGDQVADGGMPALVGVSASLPRTEYDWQIEATDGFKSKWLPTPQNVASVEARGDWRYDLSTMDFLAGNDDLRTAGLSWSARGIEVEYDASRLATAPPSGALVSRDYTSLPDDLDPVVETLTEEITANARSRFEKAVALQQWFRSDGDFVYDDSVDLGNGTDDLVRFLTPGDGGRRGYCEQFAAAMAVMARELGIPARLAVGFLRPEQVGDQEYVYSAHDLHAWPELFFSGSGWVRFEPTPGGRSGDVPSYTTAAVEVGQPTTTPSASSSAGPTIPRDSAAADPQAQTAGDGSSGGLPLGWLLWGVGAVLVVVVLALVVLGPRTLRRRRRDQRGRLGPEEAWAELHDTALDLRLPWPRQRSPWQTRTALVQHFGAPVDELTPDRPQHGPDTNPDAVAALDLIVHALERHRYARNGDSEPGTWRAEMQMCVEALHGGARRRTRRTAVWWPRSVLTRRAELTPPSDLAPERALVGSTVDHVG